MISQLEFEGNSVEKAVKKAAKELKIPERKLDYKVIDPGSSSIFRFLSNKKAKIAVFNKEEVRVEKHETDFDKKAIDPGSAERAGSREDGERKPETFPGGEEIEQSVVDLGTEIIKRISDQITEITDVHVKKERKKIIYKITGGNSAVLIGRHGKTLEAIQYLTEKVVNRKTDFKVVVEVDVEDYLETKKRTLIKIAEKKAHKAKETGRPVTIGKMNAYERRIVHLALKKVEFVKTKSVGNGSLRKVVIFPKKYKKTGGDNKKSQVYKFPVNSHMK